MSEIQGKFENKNLIVVEGKTDIQIDTIEELNAIFFGDEYENKEEAGKVLERYTRMYPYSLLKNKKIYLNNEKEVVNGKVKDTEDVHIEDGLFIKNDVAFYVSLCKINALKIMEKKSSNIFTKNVDKSNIKGNYVLVNYFADEIIKDILK